MIAGGAVGDYGGAGTTTTTEMYRQYLYYRSLRGPTNNPRKEKKQHDVLTR